ncbi:hypothetical protein K502DRAFT_326404 [Neoconidiobolus thromboides FSU 785]|nr:hypothetical protein K502DRAFT_326404 [Neoconidiobolus thromboides FSU 785]
MNINEKKNMKHLNKEIITNTNNNTSIKKEITLKKEHKSSLKENKKAMSIDKSLLLDDEFIYSKKGKIKVNNLLNFTLPERHFSDHIMGHSNNRRHHKNMGNLMFNKVKFINANFRFVLNPNQDYTVILADPDACVEWSHVEQVIVNAREEITCAICLNEPMGGRMTSCGHIYCYSCLLHYLAIENDKQWKKCPICYESIYEKALKPIHIIDNLGLKLNEKEEVEFKLMRKVGDMNFFVPANESTEWLNFAIKLPFDAKYFIPMDFINLGFNEYKFLLASEEGLVNKFNKDIKELKELENEIRCITKEEKEIYFIQLAINKIEHKMKKLNINKGLEELYHYWFNEVEKEAKEESEEVKEGKEDMEETKKVNETNIEMNNISNELETLTINSKQQHNTTIYQLNNGQFIYLYPLYNKILKEEYNNQLPPKLNLNMIYFEEISINSSVKKRYKELQFLPDTCIITLIDVKLDNIVNKDVLKRYEGALTQRLKYIKNKKKEKMENKEEISLYDSLKMGHELNDSIIINPNNFIKPEHINDNFHFPEISESKKSNSENIPIWVNNNKEVNDFGDGWDLDLIIEKSKKKKGKKAIVLSSNSSYRRR